MTVKDFLNVAKTEVSSYFDNRFLEDIRVEETEIVKANDERVHGLVLSREGSCIGANVYIDDLFMRHEAGEKMEDLMTELFDQCEYAVMFPEPDIPDVPDLTLDNIRSRLTLRLLDVRHNISYMSGRPYIDAGSGLALIAYINAGEAAAEGEWKLAVTEGMLDEIGTDKETLLTEAMKNSIRNDPPVLFALDDLAEGTKCRNLFAQPDRARTGEEGPCAYALTNKSRYHGAAALFYPEVMGKTAEIIKDDFYVLPSSAHEVILIPDAFHVPVEYLYSMVKYGNDAMPEEDRLSYNVFHYDRNMGKLDLVSA